MTSAIIKPVNALTRFSFNFSLAIKQIAITVDPANIANDKEARQASVWIKYSSKLITVRIANGAKQEPISLAKSNLSTFFNFFNVCVGELLEEREAGITNKVLDTQVKGALKDIAAEDAKNLVIAYEPVWAIGTGKTASSEDANDACKFIRETIKGLYNEEVAASVRIQYGGSVKAANANELFNTTDIDGGLVGGASLKIDEFTNIINY
jgi:hypothetical protein